VSQPFHDQGTPDHHNGDQGPGSKRPPRRTHRLVAERDFGGYTHFGGWVGGWDIHGKIDGVVVISFQ